MYQLAAIEKSFKKTCMSLGLALTLGMLFTPSTALTKVVTSPEELGPYRFESIINSRNGSIVEIFDETGPDTSVSVLEPVIDGERVEDGIIAAGTTMTSDGPATWMNVDLFYKGPNGVQSAFIDVTSRVIYDLAVFGTNGPVQVLLTGDRYSENRGTNILGSLSRARGNIGGSVSLYETDEAGVATTRVWIGPLSPAELPPGNNGAITINANQLYQVVVSSRMSMEIAFISAYLISGSSKVGPVSWSSLSEGAEVHVSRFSGQLVPSQPHLRTLKWSNRCDQPS